MCLAGGINVPVYVQENFLHRTEFPAPGSATGQFIPILSGSIYRCNTHSKTDWIEIQRRGIETIVLRL